MKINQYLLAAFFVIWQVSALGESEHKHNDHKHDHDEHEQHGSHEHGVAHLTIAVGGTGLDIALETPAANILGFEQDATSDQDKKTLEAQKAKLETPKALFSVNDTANCKPVATKVLSPLFEEHTKHEQESHEEQSHNDIDANWSFNCENSKAIENVTVNLFSAFPNGFEQIKVDWISDASASTVTLKKDGMINLK